MSPTVLPTPHLVDELMKPMQDLLLPRKVALDVEQHAFHHGEQGRRRDGELSGSVEFGSDEVARV